LIINNLRAIGDCFPPFESPNLMATFLVWKGGAR
jgi:hypothetical protein